MSSWAATLRIARRDARRARGRSLLVVAMIALPVMGVAAVDVVARTYELSPDQQATREMGAADAVYADSGTTRVRQISRNATEGGDQPRPDGTALELASVLPPGSRWISDGIEPGSVAVGDRSTSVQLRDLPYADPLAAGIVVSHAGRAPQTAGEVALSRALAERLGLGIGDRLSVAGRGEASVVGLVVEQASSGNRTVMVAPGTLALGSPADQPNRSLLVDAPRPLVWADVEAANAQGVIVRARDRLPGEPKEDAYSSGADGRSIAVVVLVAGMALLEVVLLAGPAFAVGAKRSARQLALLSATGAGRRDIRRTVLGGGLVLGAVGGLVGVAAGVGLAAAAVPVFSGIDATVPGPFDVRPLELTGVALIGVGTAVLAALLPARAAGRQDVVAALTGRRGAPAASRRTPVLGLLAAVVGAAVAFEGARRRDVLVILAGSVVAELGLVAMTPFLVGLTGRLGPLLPVAPRLALRDAARNRSRTAPAVAAILAAVAGSVAVSTFVASTDARDRAAYSPVAPPGTAVLGVHDPAGRSQLPELRAALRTSLPAREVVTVRAFDNGGPTPAGYVEMRVAKGKACPEAATQAELDARAADPRCQTFYTGGGYLPSDLVGDAAVLRAVTGIDDPALRRVLNEGGVVVPHQRYLNDVGQVRVVVHPADDPEGPGRPVDLPAAALPPSAVGSAVLYSPAAAARLGMPVADAGLVALLDRLPTEQEQDAAQGAVDRAGLDSTLYVEQGYVSDYGVGLLALAAGSALLVLGASGIATGLAAADGQTDLATLAAVGATPSLRRALAAFQSATTAVLGTALGVVAGLVPAVGLVRALNVSDDGVSPVVQRFPLVLPWEHLLVTALVVPVIAAAAAALLTRSRLPLVRRVA